MDSENNERRTPCEGDYTEIYRLTSTILRQTHTVTMEGLKDAVEDFKSFVGDAPLFLVLHYLQDRLLVLSQEAYLNQFLFYVKQHSRIKNCGLEGCDGGGLIPPHFFVCTAHRSEEILTTKEQITP